MAEIKEIVQPEEFSINEVFKATEYIIPIYQRNYAWEKDEIEQLLEDINDSDGKYYLGSLIVNQLSANIFEVIDGQQRLTTLFLLLSFLNDSTVNKNSLRFEARDKSNKTLFDIDGIKNKKTQLEKHPWYSEEIINGYEIIKKYFETRLDVEYKNNFRNKLSNIIIIRTQVPKKIDLNHYFEIMNTRGEQLELHEIVKARIIRSITKPEDKMIAATVWDACAQMDKYVQMSFEKNTREIIFGKNWDGFKCRDFGQLRDQLREKSNVCKEHRVNKFTLLDKLSNPIRTSEKDNKTAEEENERFESIISFPNFILQVNEILLQTDQEDDSGLDDKRFIQYLEGHWADNDKALSFVFNLLKYRFLFDKYIIKREYARDYTDDGRWSLQRLEAYEDIGRKNIKPLYKGTLNTDESESNKTVTLRMLQSCLRITYTSPKTMHWISKTLSAVEKNENADLIQILEGYCCDKVIAADYENCKGFGIDRIVFTYLDYILYRDNKSEFSDFQFHFRTSIEHFYPQHPINGVEWQDDALNSFGNLALITVSANSKFSNMSPASKVENYGDIIIQSPKLMKMRNLLKSNAGMWNETLVTQHNTEMIDLLKNEVRRNKYGV